MDCSDITEEQFLDILSSEDCIPKLKQMMEGGFDKDMIIDECGTPLTSSIYHKNIETAKFLVNSGADVNKFDNGLSSPLGEAIAIEHIGLVEFLVEKGADVNILHKGEDEGGECLWTPMCIAASSGNIKIMKFLLDNGGQVNIKVTEEISVGPLFSAARLGTLEMVKFLVDECGADVNALNAYSDSPLFAACIYNNTEKINFLISRGSNINPTKKGELSCLFATNFPCGILETETLKLLIEKGINLDVKNFYGEGPLISLGHSLDKMEILLKNGADPNERNKVGNTPLSRFAFPGYENHIKLLLEYDADYLSVRPFLSANQIDMIEPILCDISNDRVKAIQNS